MTPIFRDLHFSKGSAARSRISRPVTRRVVLVRFLVDDRRPLLRRTRYLDPQVGVGLRLHPRGLWPATVIPLPVGGKRHFRVRFYQKPCKARPSFSLPPFLWKFNKGEGLPALAC